MVVSWANHTWDALIDWPAYPDFLYPYTPIYRPLFLTFGGIGDWPISTCEIDRICRNPCALL